MIKVLFVCLGNICRSPTAHGVFARQVLDAGLEDVISVDSAGTSGWHNGAKPDNRSAAEALKQGYDLSFVRSRIVSDHDFAEQDLILAMDSNNLADLLERCPARYQHKLGLFLDYARLPEQEVPDPYYGGADGFADVLQLIEAGGQALLNHLRQRHLTS